MHIPTYPHQSPHPQSAPRQNRLHYPESTAPQPGRSTEIEQVGRLLTQHRVAVVVGRTGLGKTSLLKQVEAAWHGPVVRVHYGRAEGGVDFSGIEVLLAALSASAAAPAANGADDTGASSVRWADGCADPADAAMEALRRSATPGDALIVIVGADRMDLASQTVLGRLVRRSLPEQATFAFSVDSLPDDSPLALVAAVELRELGHGDLVDLAHEIAEGAMCAEAADLAARSAAGRPFALRRIVEEMSCRERSGEAPLTIPVRLGSAGESMLRDIIGTPQQDTLTLLGLLSLAPFAPCRPLAGRIRGFWEIVDELETRGIVERRGAHLRITNELVRAWAHQSMSSGERIAGHELLAFDSEGVDPLLEHWHASFTQPTDDSAPLLIADALTLIDRGEGSAGIEFVERAMRVSASEDILAAALLDVAELLCQRGDFVFASRCVRMAARSGRASIAVRARTIDIRIAFAERQTLPSHLINSWSKRELAEAPADVARLQLSLSILRCERGEYAEAEELLREARKVTDRLGEPERQLLAAATIRLEAARGRDETALESFAAMRDRDAEAFDPEYVLAVASGLTLTEHYESAQAALALLSQRSDRGTLCHTQAMCLEAEIAIRAGRIRLAGELVDEIVGDCPSPAVRPDRVLVLRCWQLLINGRTCDVEPIEAQLAALATSTDNRRLLAELNALQGSALLRMGCPAEAVRHLRRCDELSANEVNPNVRRHEADLIEALISIGRREHAGLLVQQMRKRVDRCPSRWAELALRRCEALLAAGEKGNELFNLALRSFGPHDSLFEKALTHTAFGKRLTELGSDSRAREQLLAAEAILIELGAERLVTGTGPAAGTGDVGVGPPELPELDELSEEELKVVELVRAGLKNKEIARRVFVSLRTVELRLTAAYRKLGVGSRTELVALLAGNPRLAAV